MISFKDILPKSPIEPSWDRAQVARALRSQRHRHDPLIKTAQVLEQWSTEAQSEYDSRDYEILAVLVLQQALTPRGRYFIRALSP